MTRRLLFSYLSLTIVVLAMLEVPLGFVNARNARANLTAKVERDAVSVASLSEGTLEGEASASSVRALRTVGAAVRGGHRRPGGDYRSCRRVARRFGTAGAGAAQLRRPAGVPDGAGGGRCHRCPRIANARLQLPLRRRAGRLGRRHPRSLRVDLPHVEARRAHPELLARSRGHRCNRARRRPPSSASGSRTGSAARSKGSRRPPPEQGPATSRHVHPCRKAPEEIRALALEFNDMVARVDGLVTAQRDFVADASHELRTPLTALRLRLENLERHVDAAGGDGITAAVAEVDRLSRLVDALLALARADESAVPGAEHRPGRARTGTRRCVAPDARAWCEAPTRCGALVAARAGGERLAQVLDNLIANALRAAPDGSAVTVQIRRTDAKAQAIVRDHGRGMTQGGESPCVRPILAGGLRRRGLRARARDRPPPRRARRRHDRAPRHTRRRTRSDCRIPARLRRNRAPSGSAHFTVKPTYWPAL